MHKRLPQNVKQLVPISIWEPKTTTAAAVILASDLGVLDQQWN